MVTIEQPCYTLINLPSDSDPPNEMQLKMDLGTLLFLYCSVGVTLFTIHSIIVSAFMLGL